MLITDTTTPVVVLKSVAHGGLGVVRSLGRLGIDVYTVEADAWTPALYSRFSRGSLRLDIEITPAQEALAQLQRLARRIGRSSVLIPSTDYAAIFIADHYEILQRWFIAAEQSPELLRKLYSKRELYLLARQHGIPTAESVFPRTRQEVVDFASTAEFPVVLKGIDGTRLNARCGRKMFIANSADELLAFYDRFEDLANPNLMLQEYITAEDDSVWMFDAYFNKRSECLATFTGKKIRQCPAFAGYTCLGVCLPNDVVQEKAIQFLRSLNFSGLVDMDFRYDPRTGEYKLLDVNPRMGATFRLFAAVNSLDLARAYYLDMTGQRVPESRAKQNRKWLVGDLDLVSSMRYFSHGRLSVLEWLRSLRGIEETAYFAADDPLPFLIRLAFDVVELGRRALGKFARSVKEPRREQARIVEAFASNSEVEAT